ncbi:MAG TPA: hypothetical protein VGB20_06930 [bacterium]
MAAVLARLTLAGLAAVWAAAAFPPHAHGAGPITEHEAWAFHKDYGFASQRCDVAWHRAHVRSDAVFVYAVRGGKDLMLTRDDALGLFEKACRQNYTIESHEKWALTYVVRPERTLVHARWVGGTFAQTQDFFVRRILRRLDAALSQVDALESQIVLTRAPNGQVQLFMRHVTFDMEP